ncbi:F-box only protein 36a [Centroberyx gerrardi]
MASLLGEKVFEINGQGPSPSKDFFQLVITKTEVIWRSWKISLRTEFRGVAPKELKESHYNFLHDKKLQQHVGAVFGPKILQYTIGLCQGEFDYLERLPDDILLRILSYLLLKDVTHLAQTTHRFRKLCNCEEFWEQTVRRGSAELTPDMEALARAMGWRKTFFSFFYPGSTKEKQGGS